MGELDWKVRLRELVTRVRWAKAAIEEQKQKNLQEGHGKDQTNFGMEEKEPD